MATPMGTRVEAFLAGKRFALVGVSRNEKDFSRMVMRELVRRGFDVVPVNPGAGEVDGRRSFPSVAAVVPPVQAALLMTPPARTADAVRDCLAAGVRHLWLHRGAGPGAASPEALALLAEKGIEPVADLCPFMAFPDASFGHRLHGWFRWRKHGGRAHA